MAVILDDKDYGGTGLGGENKMKYKVSDSFLIPVEITAIDGDRTAPYFFEWVCWNWMVERSSTEGYAAISL